MSSSNFATPPLKLVLGVVAIVVILHILTAFALAMIKTAVPVIKSPEVIAPIEIKIIEPPPIEPEQIETKQIEIKPIEDPIKPEVASKTKVKEESKPKNKEQSATEKEPIVKKESIVDKSKLFKVTQNNDQRLQNKENERLRVEAKRQRLLTAQAKAEAELLAKQQTQELANKQAEANRLAQEAVDKRAAQNKANREKADKEKLDKVAADKRVAEASAAEKEKDSQAELAASNDPVDFTSAEANWANRPQFSFSDKLKSESRAMAGDVFTGTLAFSVDKQGNIKKVTLAKSSGNTVIDRAAVLQAKRAKFKPFIRNGMARTGSVILPFVYNVP